MRALVLTDFHRLSVEERPDPAPAPGEALVRIAFTGICGSDLHGYTGENGRRQPGQIMGHEAVGHVAALGDPEAPGPGVGDPVTFNPMVLPEDDLARFSGREQYSPNKFVIGVRPDYPAAFAELVVVPVRNLVPLPGSVPLEYGALIEPLAVAVHAVRRVLSDGLGSALVLGGGPIGQSVLLALRLHGVDDVLVSEPDPGRRRLLSALGATVLDPADAPITDQVRARHPEGVDAAIDAVGISETLGTALDATRLGASVCLLGMGRPRLDLEAFAVSAGERSVVGSFAYSAQDFLDAADWVATAPKELALLITDRVGLDQAAATFAELAAGRMPAGKVLVRVGE